MFPQEIMDGLVIIVMFVLRIGLPVGITLAAGYWIEKKLQPREEKRIAATQPGRRVIRSGKIIQVHCWDVKRCLPAMRAQCAASLHPDLPCWLALQADGQPVREECFTCAFYKPQTKAA